MTSELLDNVTAILHTDGAPCVAPTIKPTAPAAPPMCTLALELIKPHEWQHAMQRANSSLEDFVRPPPPACPHLAPPVARGPPRQGQQRRLVRPPAAPAVGLLWHANVGFGLCRLGYPATHSTAVRVPRKFVRRRNLGASVLVRRLYWTLSFNCDTDT